MESKIISIFFTMFVVIVLGTVVLIQSANNVNTTLPVVASNEISFAANNTNTISPVDLGILSLSTYTYNSSYLTLDGTTGYFRIEEIDGMQRGTNFTYCTWFYLEQHKELDLRISDILQYGNATYDEDGYSGAVWIEMFKYNGNTYLRGSIYGNNTDFAGINRTLLDYITPEQSLLQDWHHVCLLYNTTAHMFVDGELVKSDNTPMVRGNVTTGRYQIGAGNDNPNEINHWDGSYDEIRIYNAALEPSEILQIYNSGRTRNDSLRTDDLANYFPFDDGAGTGLFDHSTETPKLFENALRFGIEFTNEGSAIPLVENTHYNYTEDGTYTTINDDYKYKPSFVSYTYNKIVNVIWSGVYELILILITLIILGVIFFGIKYIKDMYL